MKLTEMHVNLLLYAAIAVFTALNASFGSDEALKYIKPEVLFFIKTTVGALAAGLLAIKMFMSTSYSEWKVKNPSPDNAPSGTITTTVTKQDTHTKQDEKIDPPIVN